MVNLLIETQIGIMGKFWIIGLIIQITAIFLALFLLSRKKMRKKINLTLIFIFFAINFFIAFSDIFTTKMCIDKWKDISLEANPIPRFLMLKFGVNGGLLIVFLYSLLVFFSFLVVVWLIPEFFIFLERKKEKQERISERKIRLIWFIFYLVLFSFLIISYIFVPIHNLFC